MKKYTAENREKLVAHIRELRITLDCTPYGNEWESLYAEYEELNDVLDTWEANAFYEERIEGKEDVDEDDWCDYCDLHHHAYGTVPKRG